MPSLIWHVPFMPTFAGSSPKPKCCFFLVDSSSSWCMSCKSCSYKDSALGTKIGHYCVIRWALYLLSKTVLFSSMVHWFRGAWVQTEALVSESFLLSPERMSSLAVSCFLFLDPVADVGIPQVWGPFNSSSKEEMTDGWFVTSLPWETGSDIIYLFHWILSYPPCKQPLDWLQSHKIWQSCQTNM